jgi:hypothetical protein
MLMELAAMKKLSNVISYVRRWKKVVQFLVSPLPEEFERDEKLHPGINDLAAFDARRIGTHAIRESDLAVQNLRWQNDVKPPRMKGKNYADEKLCEYDEHMPAYDLSRKRHQTFDVSRNVHKIAVTALNDLHARHGIDKVIECDVCTSRTAEMTIARHFQKLQDRIDELEAERNHREGSGYQPVGDDTSSNPPGKE